MKVFLVLVLVFLSPIASVTALPMEEEQMVFKYDNLDENLNFAVLQPWESNNLKYIILDFVDGLDEEKVRSTIQAAFDLWASYSKLIFEEVSSQQEADITISFTKRGFDGVSGVLARATLPPSGVLNFDASENWLLRPSEDSVGIDLFTVALHEIGHILGILHSDVQEAIMYPYYTGPRLSLHSDDTKALQALYDFPIQRKDFGRRFGSMLRY